MKGNPIKITNLQDNQLVWLEFDYSNVTQCESDIEYEIKMEELYNTYSEGVYKVNLNSKIFINIINGNSVYFQHNLIDTIYEYKENTKSIIL